jgi:hypothetical protein
VRARRGAARGWGWARRADVIRAQGVPANPFSHARASTPRRHTHTLRPIRRVESNLSTTGYILVAIVCFQAISLALVFFSTCIVDRDFDERA